MAARQGGEEQVRLHLGVVPWLTRHSENSAAALTAQARRAESYGYDSFWLPERHLSRGAYPAPLLELAAISSCTERMRLATTSYLLPIRDPILVAEEIAVLDRISNGRLIVGLGRGYRKELFDVFGVPRAQKRARFEESLRRMIDAWRGEPIDDAGELRLWPRPVQEPHPPIWVAAFGAKALEQVGRLGLPYLASPMETLERLLDNRALHRAALPAALLEHRLPVPVMRTVLVTDEPGLESQAKQAAARESRGFLDALGRQELEPSTENAIIGDEAEVMRELARYVRSLAMTHLIVRTGPGDLDAEVLEHSVRALPRLLRGAPLH